jgi:hypothetical protein
MDPPSFGLRNARCVTSCATLERFRKPACLGWVRARNMPAFLRSLREWIPQESYFTNFVVVEPVFIT